MRAAEGRRGRGRRLHYAWVVAAVAFFTLLAAAGFRAASGVLILPLQDEFGWSRATISLAVSVNLVLFGLSGPFAAALMNRYGLRKVVLTALVAVSIGAAATTQINASWQLVALWGVVVGAGSGCMATVFAATVASRWFVERRGVVTGALTAATATGQLAFLPFLAWLTESRGWRWLSVTIALSALVAVPVIAKWLRDKPEDVGLLAYGAAEGWSTPPPTPRPLSAAFDALRVAARTPAFFLLAGSFFVCGASTNGLVGTHFIAAAVDSGIGQTSAGALLAAVGVFDIIGTLASGWLTDRIDPRRLLFAYYGLRGLALVFLHHVLDARGIGLLGSWSSTGSTGLPRSRRRSRSATTCSGRRGPASSTAGCSHRTRSVPPPRRMPRARRVALPAATSSRSTARPCSACSPRSGRSASAVVAMTSRSRRCQRPFPVLQSRAEG